jgi:hypothetical protein
VTATAWTPAEVRAARERLRTFEATGSIVKAYGKDWAAMEVGRDRNAIVSNAILESDAEPIGIPLVLELGFTETEPGLFYHKHGIVVSEYDGVFMATALPSMDNKLIPTQAGELRRLLSLLDDITTRNSKGAADA